jgi:hypothetical protein
MHEWFVGGEVVLLAVVILVLMLVVLALRRRWLARQGGTFECSFRLRTSTPGAGWSLGVARYNDENFEWFRFFSFSLNPRKSFVRNSVHVLDDREPDAVEAVSLYAGQRVVSIEATSGASVESCDLAMSRESLTGLLSWLEAAPPGLVGY